MANLTGLCILCTGSKHCREQKQSSKFFLGWLILTRWFPLSSSPILFFCETHRAHTHNPVRCTFVHSSVVRSYIQALYVRTFKPLYAPLLDWIIYSNAVNIRKEINLILATYFWQLPTPLGLNR